jgi:hypothetical protein
LKTALARPWGMYNDSTRARVDERIKNAKLLKKLADKKNKMEKKYTSLFSDVKKIVECIEKQVMENNLAKMNNNTEAAKLALSEFEYSS